MKDMMLINPTEGDWGSADSWWKHKRPQGIVYTVCLRNTLESHQNSAE